MQALSNLQAQSFWFSVFCKWSPQQWVTLSVVSCTSSWCISPLSSDLSPALLRGCPWMLCLLASSLSQLASIWVQPLGSPGGRMEDWRKREARIFLSHPLCLIQYLKWRQCLSSRASAPTREALWASAGWPWTQGSSIDTLFCINRISRNYLAPGHLILLFAFISFPSPV